MIYADYNGTAPLLEEVKKYLTERLAAGPFANPNAIHGPGRKVSMALENCRNVCADFLGALPKQVLFNSGASEGISQVIFSLAKQAQVKNKMTVLTSPIEHSAVVQSLEAIKTLGFNIVSAPVNPAGEINAEELVKIVQEYEGQIGFCSIMAANNETGVIQPLQELGTLLNRLDIPFFSDTTQLIGKIPFSFSNSPFDFAVCSGHKIGALPGSGVVLAKDPTLLSPLIHGGGQEFGLRGGTQNYIAQESLAVAFDSIKKHPHSYEELAIVRDAFEQRLLDKFPNVVIFGKQGKRLPSTTMLSYPGLHGQGVQIELESRDIFVTTSSACSDNEPETSRVLQAMGVPDDQGRGAIRISLGSYPANKVSYSNTFNEIYLALEQTFQKLLKISSY